MAPCGRSCKGDEQEQHDSRMENNQNTDLKSLFKHLWEEDEAAFHRFNVTAAAAGLVHVSLGASSGLSHRG